MDKRRCSPDPSHHPLSVSSNMISQQRDNHLPFHAYQGSQTTRHEVNCKFFSKTPKCSYAALYSWLILEIPSERDGLPRKRMPKPLRIYSSPATHPSSLIDIPLQTGASPSRESNLVIAAPSTTGHRQWVKRKSEYHIWYKRWRESVVLRGECYGVGMALFDEESRMMEGSHITV